MDEFRGCNMKWNSGVKTKGMFRITLKDDVISHLCMSTILSEIKKWSKFEPTSGYAMSHGSRKTIWFEMEKVEYSSKPVDFDLFKTVCSLHSAIENVYGVLNIEVEGLTSQPFINIEKSYED